MANGQTPLPRWQLGREDMAALPALGGGQPYPLGVHRLGAMINLAIPVAADQGLIIDRFDAGGQRLLARHRIATITDGVAHAQWPADAEDLVYGLRSYPLGETGLAEPAKLLIDPWARALLGRCDEHVGHLVSGEYRLLDSAAITPKAKLVTLPVRFTADQPRPWRPRRESMLIAETHVRGATRLHPEVAREHRGGYLGLAAPALIAHLKRLGVTSLSLLPLATWVDEAALNERGLCNYWGYNPLAMMVPEARFASKAGDGDLARVECQAMIDALHEAGIEVIVDVVFNHSAEAGALGPMLSQRGLDARRWYRQNADGDYLNWSGCGNSLHLGQPLVIRWVLDVLRHWAGCYGVDGFRFDLATCLGRGDDAFSPRAACLAAILQDPLLAACHLIAEPWDLGPDGYQLGRFPPGFAEWNDRCRDGLRRYWLGHDIRRGEWAERWAGSADHFRHSGRSVLASINYVSAHDGFTLRDLLCYSHKHNAANGEDNRDGRDGEPSTNCGVEGESNDPIVVERRRRRSRALLAALLLCRGTPMLRLGDEIGQSQRGNNNAYCQDNPIAWIDWPKADLSLVAVVVAVAAIRRAWPRFFGGDWLDRPELIWLTRLGLEMSADDWLAADERELALLFTDAEQGRLYLASNPGADELLMTLPTGPWQCAFDSCLAEASPTVVDNRYCLAAESLAVLFSPAQ